ncbi:Neuroligin 4-like [Araneus ventricosus]|uniref:Neuroligin 4-like n=1 Tax=Araneus ventricosus TaxID=182803 RepID=A0A4Y2LND9_ARAVE|nr:Neuroligin 4-like [Araneus ventricosus]
MDTFCNSRLPLKEVILIVFLGIWFSKGLLGAVTETQRASSRVVSTKYGSLRGVIVTLSNRHLQPVEKFLGVPYAGVPTGSLRFMPPVTPPHWKGVRSADHLGPVCPQKLPDISNETEALKRMPAGRLDYLKRLLPFLTNQSEDCLYLNIYAPASGKPFIRLFNFIAFN